MMLDYYSPLQRTPQPPYLLPQEARESLEEMMRILHSMHGQVDHLAILYDDLKLRIEALEGERQ